MDSQHKRSILVVDDVQLNREILKDVFADHYEVVDAPDGRVALEILREKDIAAVLLDIVMPEMDGYEVLKVIRGDPALSEIPVIVLTAIDDEENQIKALELGATDVVSKPFNPRMVRVRVRNVIDKRSSQQLKTKNKILQIQLDQQKHTIQMAERDSLTGLYTRDAFCRKASQMINNKPTGFYSITCMDVDGFKVINDQYGMSVGDQVLQYVAGLIDSFILQVGGIASRMFTDNFCVLYPSARVTDMDYIPEYLNLTFLRDGYHFMLQGSAGCYRVNDLSLPVSAMLDRALLAKSTIKGRYDIHLAHYDASMRDSVIEEQWVIRQMERALMEGQFEPWFQPQHNHITGAMVGVEVLARWRHPQKGLISPGLFIPIFERNGFIYAMDQAIWRQTCVQLRRWLDAGIQPPAVSVNVSRYDIFRADFFEIITGYVHEYNIPLELFRLEITESAFARSTEQIIVIVQRLRDFGFTVEIDDFGSGYSSFNTLKDVPANVLKIDMRFLSGHSQRGGSILEAIVRMAKWLNMAVIAEGVETVEQADFLRSVGCPYLQGYLYARPMPLDEFEKLITSQPIEYGMERMHTVDELSAEAFWQPDSLSTMVFNRFVGGACVFERWEGKLEMLRVNEQLSQVFHNGLTAVDMMEVAAFNAMDEHSRRRLEAAVECAAQTGKPEVVEVKYVGDGSLCEHIRLTIRMIAHTDDREMFYGYAENVTAQRQAEAVIEESYRQLRFLNSVSRDLIVTSDADKAIDNAMQKILRYFNGDRVYVLEGAQETDMLRYTYEVCAPGVMPEKDEIQCIHRSTIWSWLEMLEKGNHIYISDADALGEERREERELLLQSQIHSLIAVAMRSEECLIGVLAVDSPRRNLSAMEHLEALGDYMAVMLVRRDLNARQRSDREALLQLMGDTPCGFVRARLDAKRQPHIVFANDGLCQMLQMTREQVLTRFGQEGSAVDMLCPQDRHIFESRLEANAVLEGTRQFDCRVMTGDGDLIYITIFGRATHDDRGVVYLNLYYFHKKD